MTKVIDATRRLKRLNVCYNWADAAVAELCFPVTFDTVFRHPQSSAVLKLGRPLPSTKARAVETDRKMVRAIYLYWWEA